ncbi:MAG: hypothetical protein QXF28_05655 [Nitrososphaerota archaeon]
MDRIILSERVDEVSDIRSLQEWFNQLLKDAGVEVSIGRINNRWLYVEASKVSLFSSMLNLQVYYPLEVAERPILRTCWVEKIQGNNVTYSYPLIDGSSKFSRSRLDDWVGYLGCGKDSLDCLDVLKSTGVQVGYPINLTINKPSVLYRKLLERLTILGLDVVFVRGLTPLELNSILDREIVNKFTADYIHLTLTTHILYLKLGVKPSKAIEKLSETASKLSIPLTYTICEWKKLESILSLLETNI